MSGEERAGSTAFFPVSTSLLVAPLPLPPIWNNSLRPRLDLGPDHLAFRCFGTALVPLAEVTGVDFRSFLGQRITIRRAGRRIRYLAWFFNRAEALRLLSALRDAGLPLTPRALAALP
jgi:hypothetical protein